jgi:hypothetical protein
MLNLHEKERTKSYQDKYSQKVEFYMQDLRELLL